MQIWESESFHLRGIFLRVLLSDPTCHLRPKSTYRSILEPIMIIHYLLNLKTKKKTTRITSSRGFPLQPSTALFHLSHLYLQVFFSRYPRLDWKWHMKKKENETNRLQFNFQSFFYIFISMIIVVYETMIWRVTLSILVTTGIVPFLKFYFF